MQTITRQVVTLKRLVTLDSQGSPPRVTTSNSWRRNTLWRGGEVGDPFLTPYARVRTHARAPTREVTVAPRVTNLTIRPKR